MLNAFMKFRGNMLLPSTWTSRVPAKQSTSAFVQRVARCMGICLPSLVSSKHRAGSCLEVNSTTSWPRCCSETAASTTRRSAPPIPRSGWMNPIRSGLGVFSGGGMTISADEIRDIPLRLQFALRGRTARTPGRDGVGSAREQAWFRHLARDGHLVYSAASDRGGAAGGAVRSGSCIKVLNSETRGQVRRHPSIVRAPLLMVSRMQTLLPSECTVRQPLLDEKSRAMHSKDRAQRPTPELGIWPSGKSGYWWNHWSIRRTGKQGEEEQSCVLCRYVVLYMRGLNKLVAKRRRDGARPHSHSSSTAQTLELNNRIISSVCDNGAPG